MDALSGWSFIGHCISVFTDIEPSATLLRVCSSFYCGYFAGYNPAELDQFVSVSSIKSGHYCVDTLEAASGRTSALMDS